ncbi:hypothetical protein M1555_02065 [Patescibacteria group bacterium]|nr:hypothetical protein [Patescibacteria group bacterium]
MSRLTPATCDTTPEKPEVSTETERVFVSRTLCPPFAGTIEDTGLTFRVIPQEEVLE